MYNSRAWASLTIWIVHQNYSDNQRNCSHNNSHEIKMKKLLQKMKQSINELEFFIYFNLKSFEVFFSSTNTIHQNIFRPKLYKSVQNLTFFVHNLVYSRFFSQILKAITFRWIKTLTIAFLQGEISKEYILTLPSYSLNSRCVTVMI